MTPFRVTAIDSALAAQARVTLRSPQYGHPAHAEIATGYGPCRLCLRRFRTGQDRRILFTYDPFAGLDPYACPGPIFVHEAECSRFESVAIFPEELRQLPLTLEGYGADRWIMARDRPNDSAIEQAIQRLFEHPEVQYIHVRNAEAGCFIALIQRVTPWQ